MIASSKYGKDSLGNGCSADTRLTKYVKQTETPPFRTRFRLFVYQVVGNQDTCEVNG